MTTVRETIQRDLDDEIQSVIKVAETSRLATDLREYVLTDLLAKQFGDVFAALVAGARPATTSSGKTGIWVSGFFGSGKSHFAKLIGHLAANTLTDAGPARELFRTRLRPGHVRHDRISELLQEADTHGLKAQLVAFDITALHGDSTENTGRIFLKALFRELGLSSVITFAELEMEIDQAGKREEFLAAYRAASDGSSWEDDRDLPYVSAQFAEAVATVLPKFKTADEALRSIELSENVYQTLSIDGVVTKLLRWLDDAKALGSEATSLFFVADEVGAWAGRNLQRIEELRALAEAFGSRGEGRLWMLATSQERLSDVVQNSGIMDTKTTQEFIQRLEARFGVNVHLEPSEVGTVIEDRVLRKKPASRPVLESVYKDHQAWAADVAAKPGLDLLGEYPGPNPDRFVQDYPFLPYQLPLAADIFGAMRGVKVSSGARSMLKVAFDATRGLADTPVGSVVSWDRIFDAANGDNEFADENYLGTPGLQSLERADEDLRSKAAFDRPSRILKVLWLMQQTTRVPCTESNLARLLVDQAGTDVLDLERRLRTTLDQLRALNYVRQDAGSGQWRFLTPDEVTVEKIVSTIAGDLPAKEVRDRAAGLYGERLKALGSVLVGKSGTSFDYGVQLNGAPLKNDAAPIQLKVWFGTTRDADRIREDHAAYVEDSAVYWVVTVPERLDERLRRVAAIERLRSDPKFNEIRTARTDLEADKLSEEANQIRRQATEDLHRALGNGVLYWGGGSRVLNEAPSKDTNVPARGPIEDAVKDRIALRYPRFTEGDRKFEEKNIERLLVEPPAKRAGLDPDLGLFDADGHVHADNVVASALITYLNGATKTAGRDLRQHFGAPPFGWPVHLPRYVATALFVDGRVALVDKSGVRHDDPRKPAARVVVGSRDFSDTRVVVEENPLTPDEATAVRELLSDLGEPTKDSSELTLHAAAQSLLQKMEKRLGVTERARAVNLPLPEIFAELRSSVDEIAAASSRSSSLRALLAHRETLVAGNAALTGLEGFVGSHGLDQFRRAEQLAQIARQAGLEEDPELGIAVADAGDQIEQLKTQRRVIEEWTGAYQAARETILGGYRSRYAPVYAAARAKVEGGRAAILQDDDFRRLAPEKSAQVRIAFMGAGRPLQEIPDVALTSDADLISATSAFSLALLRSRIDEVDREVARAHAMIAELLAEKPKDTQATWSTSALTGKVFSSEASVDHAFDAEKDRIKTLIRQGKTVRAIYHGCRLHLGHPQARPHGPRRPGDRAPGRPPGGRPPPACGPRDHGRPGRRAPRGPDVSAEEERAPVTSSSRSSPPAARPASPAKRRSGVRRGGGLHAARPARRVPLPRGARPSARRRPGRESRPARPGPGYQLARLARTRRAPGLDERAVARTAYRRGLRSDDRARAGPLRPRRRAVRAVPDPAPLAAGDGRPQRSGNPARHVRRRTRSWAGSTSTGAAELKNDVYTKLANGGKIEDPKELAAATCLYTERYIVDYLVQNTLGATWVEMHPETDAPGELALLRHARPRGTRRSSGSRSASATSPSSTPACGSGHFLVRAFDLFAQLYAEEGIEKPEDVPGLILERNLYGADIDRRAVQIAALALYLKGCELAGAGLPAPQAQPRRLRHRHPARSPGGLPRLPSRARAQGPCQEPLDRLGRDPHVRLAPPSRARRQRGVREAEGPRQGRPLGGRHRLGQETGPLHHRASPGLHRRRRRHRPRRPPLRRGGLPRPRCSSRSWAAATTSSSRTRRMQAAGTSTPRRGS